jgi:prepilin-type N-terminal cleavage/methylation domain-containing protein
MERIRLDPDDAMRRSRSGFSLVEVIVAMTILTGALLGFAAVAQKFTRSNTDVLTRTMASEIANARIEQIKGARPYATLVSTYNNVSESWSGTNAWAGFARRTVVTRTGPSATADYVTVTVIVSGRGLNPVIRRTTSIAAF